MGNSVQWRFRVGGMTCINCQNKIQQKLRRTPGIQNARVDYGTGMAEVAYDPDRISREKIRGIVTSLGYEVQAEAKPVPRDWVRSAGILLVIFGLFWILERSGVLNLLAPDQVADSTMSYGMLFLIGLVTSVHCVAMCGGINLSQCLPRQGADGGEAPQFRAAAFYNLGRVISYTLIGFLLGGVGMLFGAAVSAGTSHLLQGALKLLAGALMVVMGLNMLGLFPALRRLTPRLPKRLVRAADAEKRRRSGPFAVGLLNGLMPCGPLQAMQTVALASGSPLSGALSMLLFSLGTVPLMLGLGTLVSALGKRFTRQVMSVGAVLVVVLGLSMFSQGLSLSGLSLSGAQGGVAVVSDGGDAYQTVSSTLSRSGYPSITVKAGVPVKWVIDVPSNALSACNYQMQIPEYGIVYTFQEGENVIEFTPEDTGTFVYSCWMGMIRATIEVTD